jgi:hypothetical protein
MNTAYCGLFCDSCQIHLATFEQDKALQMKMRSEIAEKCNKLYGTTLQAGDINDCDGCRAESGKLFSGCLNCGIRKCAMARSIENCACCNDYVCDILEKHFILDPEARKRLEEIRQQI